MHPELDLLPVADVSNGLYAVSYGEVDAFIANVATASYYIEKLAIQNLRAAGESGFSYKLGIASRSDWPVLHRLLQKSVDSISNEERQAIYRKWIGLKPEFWKPTREQLIAFAVALIIIGFGITLTWNRQLRKTVEFRTQELRVSEEEARVARETAEQANRAKTDFLAAASHDLRQPLHAMSLQIGQMKESLQDKKAEAMLDQISNSQFALSDILNALLDISHLDAGTLKPNYSHFPLAQLFTRLENEFTPQARERGVELRIRSTAAWLYSDATLLYRVLANLVDNAIKHTRAQGVLIAARKRGDNWRIEIWDCGLGIPEEQQQKIFGEFVQLDNPGRDRRKGLGLGLSIAQRLNQLLGLQLNLISRSGYGSCFRLEVPEGAPIPQQSGEPLTGEERGYRLQGAVVLVVDDDPDVLTATRNLLTGWQCAVVTASSLEEAVTVAADEDIDMIIADYRLADGHTGLDVIEALNKYKNKNGNGQSKAVIITGDVNPEELSKLRDGRYPVLSKPVAPVTLRSTLHRIMTD
jgi:signal transduction histidine kinase/CheY-like chemotaxis protein